MLPSVFRGWCLRPATIRLPRNVAGAGRTGAAIRTILPLHTRSTRMERWMYRATANITLPTTIIGSLPRPSWYSEELGKRPFLDAMVNARFREQYTDAVSVYLRDQETAGLDIVTDGDAHYDNDVGGQSWTS